MPVIRVSDQTWQRLQRHARPFEDKPEDVVNMALNALEEALGIKTAVKLKSKLAPKREGAGSKLPQKEFRAPLVTTLRDLGGGAHVSEIKAELEKRIGHMLGDGDLVPVSNGDPRWWNATCWERDSMVKESTRDRVEARLLGAERVEYAQNGRT